MRICPTWAGWGGDQGLGGAQPGIQPSPAEAIGRLVYKLWDFYGNKPEAAPKQRSAVPAEFQVVGIEAHPISLLILLFLTLVLFPKLSQQHPKVLGNPRGGSILLILLILFLLLLSAAGPTLPGGISSSCHCSRSVPLIAVNYFGVNGDVLCTSTAE